MNCFQIVSLTYWSQPDSKTAGNNSVVNCFQIVSLTYWSQHNSWIPIVITCCELLSNCIFDILVTTSRSKRAWLQLLWIAFKLYLWHIGHNHFLIISSSLLLWIAFKLYLWHIGHNIKGWISWPIRVVNCFQIVSLTYWSQPSKKAWH